MTTINATTTIDLTEDMRNEAQRCFSALFIEQATEELLKQEQLASQLVPEAKYLSPPPQLNSDAQHSAAPKRHYARCGR